MTPKMFTKIDKLFSTAQTRISQTLQNLRSGVLLAGSQGRTKSICEINGGLAFPTVRETHPENSKKLLKEVEPSTEEGSIGRKNRVGIKRKDTNDTIVSIGQNSIQSAKMLTETKPPLIYSIIKKEKLKTNPKQPKNSKKIHFSTLVKSRKNSSGSDGNERKSMLHVINSTKNTPKAAKRAKFHKVTSEPNLISQKKKQLKKSKKMNPRKSIRNKGMYMSENKILKGSPPLDSPQREVSFSSHFIGVEKQTPKRRANFSKLEDVIMTQQKEEQGLKSIVCSSLNFKRKANSNTESMLMSPEIKKRGSKQGSRSPIVRQRGFFVDEAPLGRVMVYSSLRDVCRLSKGWNVFKDEIQIYKTEYKLPRKIFSKNCALPSIDFLLIFELIFHIFSGISPLLIDLYHFFFIFIDFFRSQFFG